MIALPAWVWRFGLIGRALIVGVAVGVFVALLAWIGSNLVLPALVVLAVVTPLYTAVTARRMSGCWPGAKNLRGADRVAIVRAARSGRDIGDPRLAPAVIEYTRGLHDAAERVRLWWWLIVLLGVVALGTAIADTIFAPIGETVLSWLYFAFFPIEIWWWPRRQAHLLANADCAKESARHLLDGRPDAALP